MTKINLNELIKQLRQYMAATFKEINVDKISPFQDIESFLENELNKNELSLVAEKLTLLKQEIEEKETEQLEDFDVELIHSHIEKSYSYLSIIYLLMLKTNKKAILEIDDDVLYLVINAMRNVPYAKYDESIIKLLYPKLMAAVKQEGPNDESSKVLNILTDMIIKDDTPFNIEQLDEYMNKFLFNNVYTRLGVPDTIVGADRIKIESFVNKIFIAKTIKKANEIESSYADKLNENQAALCTYDSLDMPVAMIHLAFARWLKANGIKPFQQVNLQLIALRLGQMKDITTIEQEQLFERLCQLEEEDIPSSEYVAFLNKGKLF